MTILKRIEESLEIESKCASKHMPTRKHSDAEWRIMFSNAGFGAMLYDAESDYHGPDHDRYCVTVSEQALFAVLRPYLLALKLAVETISDCHEEDCGAMNPDVEYEKCRCWVSRKLKELSQLLEGTKEAEGEM